ncbi:TPA: DUF2703 domain-containing protein [Legionella pneumophila]|nr:DUF2703 domain-containing protein [Legionella pneumophila]HAU1176529.1 DUF2703 domain-containing protein [Legionella pneumophila]HAU2503098.1 DUF2703 domain-containing protein [Legionella pneumophila]HAU3545568.1 DUF2703 domain-containing protein [Legionella pneumophila]HDU8239580.1 DUF2703 domain-containing protein [Legionella pneumophila]
MKPMQILWKRLVKGGETCTRCEATGRELKAAVTKLEAVLRPLGIEPVLETHEINEVAFKSNTSESNRVWITGKPIEEWLGANVGMNRCCSVCGESDCRTLEVGGCSYETIPEEQFIKAGLMAASQMIASESSPNKTASSCCSSTAEANPCQPTLGRDKS